ncbi:BREX system serine/threonine kinase PglW [Kibdelosporangium aridum]|uniref:BREX system serine/threonine kinase PglW n=1 Tax=Kibdelosporangium aridum TaxID=2030 RepID=A0A428Z293_KIBAR|nr:BREX system serine/threonine kinase PglW [Kibdelosporangium aridum]RSM79382.1 BREX system serine/threonine kinase PglW [Kibdelosporangium aridum]
MGFGEGGTVDEGSTRWHEIALSEFDHERAGLAQVRRLLPDRYPFQAWSNFTFISPSGHPREVDLLVAVPSGLFLLELKNIRGSVRSRHGTWITQGGATFDHPLLGADQKAKELKKLLANQAQRERIPVPFLSAAVFLTEQGMRCELEDGQRAGVYGPEDGRSGLPRIGSDLLLAPPARQPPDPRFFNAVDRLLRQVGIRPSERMVTVGRWRIDERPYETGPTWQDHHASRDDLPGEHRRVRIYLYERAADPDKRRSIAQAAQREYQACRGMRHPGLLRPDELESHPLGPALIIDQAHDAMRLDHYLARHQDELDLPTKVDMFRQLAEAVRYAHERRLVHRALSPRAIVVEPTGQDWTRPLLRVGEWQAAARGLSGPDTVHRLVPTSGAGGHVDPGAEPYLAPEFGAAEAGVPLDVFGVGAVGYLLFTGQPPAADRAELKARLRAEGGLHPSAVVDGIPDDLLALIAMCTAPVVGDRFADLDDVLAELDKALAEPAGEDAKPPKADPWEAVAGDYLADTEYRVVQVLGTGATARAFKVDRDGWDSVLKVSRSEDAALRLADEHATLEDLRHDHLVGLRRGLFAVGERHAIELDFAGSRTLAQLLRTEGALLPDQLQRYGDQLLDVLGYLERKQVLHRDIKPDNLGIREHPKLGNSLVLFDFSLAGVPASDLQAGTRGYVDPFLDGVRRPVYDAAAERYAAAVTLHEMASLELPSWNADGTDPAFGGDVVLSSELFAAPLRDQLVEFFTTALHRDADQRHQSIGEMRAAWRRVFTAIDETGPATNSRSDSEDPSELRDEAAEQATLDTALDAAGLSPRAVAVAQRLGAQTVGDLVDLPYRTLWNARGLSKRTRQELVNRHTQWRRSLLGSTAEAGQPSSDELLAPLERIVPSLVPVPRRREDSQVAITRMLLGLPEDIGVVPDKRWPTNVEVAGGCGLTSGRIAQVLSARRKAWIKNDYLKTLHDELVETLTGLRRVATAAELAERLLSQHGCADTVPVVHRLPFAYAVLRAVIERDVLAKEPRFAIRRHDGRILVALQAINEEPLDTVSDTQLLDLAADLGDVAKELAGEDPLPTPTAVVRRLLDRARHMDWVWGERRLVQLAASASGTVLSNARMELYPRDLDPARALRLAQAGAGLPDEGLTATALKQRVTNRFPGLSPLPDGRALWDLCRRAGFELNWDGERFHSPSISVTGLASRLRSSSSSSGHPVVEGSASADAPARLVDAMRHGGVRFVTVRPRRASKARARIEEIVGVPVLDVSAKFVRILRAQAKAAAISNFEVVLRADAADPGSRDQLNLSRLLDRTFDALAEELAGQRVLVLDGLTPLGRYPAGTAMLNRLIEHARYGGSADGPDTLILLCPAENERQHPRVGAFTLPQGTPEEWIVGTSAWLEPRTGAA